MYALQIKTCATKYLFQTSFLLFFNATSTFPCYSVKVAGIKHITAEGTLSQPLSLLAALLETPPPLVRQKTKRKCSVNVIESFSNILILFLMLKSKDAYTCVQPVLCC